MNMTRRCVPNPKRSKKLLSLKEDLGGFLALLGKKKKKLFNLEEKGFSIS